MISQEDIQKLKTFSQILKVKFRNIGTLKTALTHRSYLNEQKGQKIEHNERLEFLGDAVLELLVSRYLFDKYPNKPEGELTSFRAAIVRTESLYEEAIKLNFGKFLYMSKGEEQTGGRTRPYILANAFEAIAGAIYLDRGLDTTKKFLEWSLFYKIPEIVSQRLDIDNKSKLQEISQDVLRETPIYKVIRTTGPDHAKVFTSAVLIKEKIFGKGKGYSKQESEQNAAKKALENWKELLNKNFDM